ncbi:MAG: FadR family transcriptional regulator [Candidatus Adiutrix sp.]|jgi:GntR family transcriptional repressor for pyruvate dehydrogenase complex|nr:FadR family transcriptional regulator [Candidatus Adiutrix sp.]
MSKTITKLSAVDEVFNYLHQRIASGELPEGHRFPTQDLMAEEFGVSRSTVREAINKLTLLGFLSAKPGVGTIVVNSSASGYVSAVGQHIFLKSTDVIEFMEARLYLEQTAVKLAVRRASKEDIKNLNRMLIEQGRNVGDGDRFSRLDSEFHRALIEISQNKVMMQFLGLIWDGLSQFITEVTRIKTAASHAYVFHARLVKHITDRNLEKAELTLVEHLHDVAVNIEEHFKEHAGLSQVFKTELANLPGWKAD